MMLIKAMEVFHALAAMQEAVHVPAPSYCPPTTTYIHTRSYTVLHEKDSFLNS